MSDAVHYLEQAIEAIGQRARERDIEAERSASRAAKMFSELTGKQMTELEAWQFMCCLKLVRSATGKFKSDDFVDLAGYAALAGESAEKSFSRFQNLEPPKDYAETIEDIVRETRHGGNMLGKKQED